VDSLPAQCIPDGRVRQSILLTLRYGG
jgi:hypothetical protein